MTQMTEILKRLKNEFSPTRVYLFGSRADQTSKSDSDYDFVLVVNEAKVNRLDCMAKSREVLRDLGVVADVFVYTENEFNRLKNEFSSVPELAYSTGKELSLNGL